MWFNSDILIILFALNDIFVNVLLQTIIKYYICIALRVFLLLSIKLSK